MTWVIVYDVPANSVAKTLFGLIVVIFGAELRRSGNVHSTIIQKILIRCNWLGVKDCANCLGSCVHFKFHFPCCQSIGRGLLS